MQDFSPEEILHYSPTAIFQLSEEGMVVFANAKALALFENDSPVNQPVDEVLKGLIDHTGNTISFQYLAKKGYSASYTVYLQKGVAFKHLALNTSVIPNNDGTENMLISLSDLPQAADVDSLNLPNSKTSNATRSMEGWQSEGVSDPKKALALIEKKARHYQRMVEEAPFGISIYNKDGLLVAANERVASIWDIDLKEYVNKFNILTSEVFHSESAVQRLKEAFSGFAGETTSRLLLPNQTYRWFTIKYYSLFGETGKVERVVFFTDSIDAYKEATETIEVQRSLKQQILDALNEAIVVVDSRGTIIDLNRHIYDYFGRSKEKNFKTGQSIFNFIDPLNESEYLKERLNAMLTQSLKLLNYELKLDDGRWYNLRATPLPHRGGAVISFQNINTKKEIEIALEKSLRKYRDLYNKAPVMMHSVNAKQEFVSVSDYWLGKMGYERSEVIGKKAADFMEESSAKNIAGYFEALTKEGKLRNIALQFTRKSGKIMDVLFSAVAEFDSDGKLDKTITGMVDITEFKKVQIQLEESEARLLESQRISKIADYSFDVSTGVFRPSKELIYLMGFQKGDNHLNVMAELVHPEDLATFTAQLEKAIAEGTDFFHTYRIKHLRTKKLKWISGRGKMISDQRGKVVRMVGTIQDVTQQKIAEQKIQKLSNRIVLATEIAKLGVWEFDAETRQVYWENQMYTIFHADETPFHFRSLVRYMDANSRRTLRENLTLVKNGINFLEFEMGIFYNGERKFLRTFTRVTRDAAEHTKGMVGVVYDITNDKKMQMKLQSSLDEKNVLVKEVHHRVKNNLQLISSILALKSYELKDAHSQAIFSQINDRIKAMSVIHDKLYTFHNVSKIDIQQYISGIVSELQILQVANPITIHVSAEKEVMDVEKALLIGLITSELISNAMKHGFTESDRGKIVVTFRKKSERYELKVVNNGQKISSEILESSEGLGMSLVKTFVRQLVGKLTINDENGFTIQF